MTTTTLDQLTHEITTIEQALARIHRELVRFRITHPTPDHRQTLASQITAMSLPVSNWEDMEATLYGGRTCF